MKKIVIEVIPKHQNTELWIVPENIPNRISREWLKKNGKLIGIPKNLEDYVRNYSYVHISKTYRQEDLSEYFIEE